MADSPIHLLEQNQNPELVTIYRKMRSTNLDTLTQDNLTEIALIILSKPADKRNSTDIKLLVECTKNVKFFQDLTIENGKDSHENCCKYMTFEFFAADETIFQLGSAGFKFYIILKGSVGVFVNIPKTIEEINEKGETLKRIEYVLTDVRTLNTGASFGELALIDNKPRAATIKCKSDSYFAVLEKKDFNVILKEKEQKKLNTEVEFLKSLDLLSSWSYKAVKLLFYHTAIKTYSMKSEIYKENDEPLYFYIIRSGEFQIDIPVELPLEGSLLFKQKFEKYQNKYSICSRKTMKKYMKFAILSKNEYFGFEELINNTKRNHRVICLSEHGEVSVVNKKEFMRRLWGEPKTQENLIRIISRNNEMKQIRINELVSIETSIGILRKPTVFDNYRIDGEETKRLNNKAYMGDSKIFDSTNSVISITNNDSLNFNSCERRASNFQKILLNEKKSIVLQKILLQERKKRTSVSDIPNKNTFILNKLKPSKTFHDLETGSIIHLLEDSQNISKKHINEISQINETNLMNYAQNHDFSMNLHRKLQSLEIRTKNLNESHITSKLDVMQELRSSFKPMEIVKLKAFQQLNQKQNEFENYSKFRRKKRIEDYKNYFIPKIVQRSLNERMEINKTLARLNLKIETPCKKTKFLNLLTEEKLLEIERRRGENRKYDYLKKDNGEHHRVKSLMTMNRDLLPLKYNIEKYEKKKVVFKMPERIHQN